MNSIKALVPYRIETIRVHAPGAGTPQDSQEEHAPASAPRNPAGSSNRQARSTAFIAQLMVHSDSDLRRSLGRADVAGARVNAYAQALANRPSAQGLCFRQVVGKA